MNGNISRTLALLSVSVMVLTALIAVIPAADAEQSYDVDLGKKYSMKTQLIWDGTDAESILYEFDDGTTSTEWNPLKEWTTTGYHYITQTAYNSYNGGSSSTTVYRIEIMGYPEIHFEENGGSEVADIEQTAYEVTAAQPADPTKDGYKFTGWYTDSACTQKFDWSTKLTEDITLYAGWQSTGTTPGGDDSGDDGGDDENGFQIEVWMIILVVVAIAAIVAVFYLKG